MLHPATWTASANHRESVKWLIYRVACLVGWHNWSEEPGLSPACLPSRNAAVAAGIGLRRELDERITRPSPFFQLGRKSQGFARPIARAERSARNWWRSGCRNAPFIGS
jgi:hypothetical protein